MNHKHVPIKDPARIAALLGVVEKITTVAPQATHLLGSAMSEIHEANDFHKQEGVANAKAQAEDEARKAHEAQVLEQARDARARLDAEADAKKQAPIDQKVVTEADKIEDERRKREEALKKEAAPVPPILTQPDPSGPKVNTQTDKPLPLSSSNLPRTEPVFPRKIDPDNGGGPV